MKKYFLDRLIPAAITALVASMATEYSYQQKESYMESEEALLEAEKAGMKRMYKSMQKMIVKECLK